MKYTRYTKIKYNLFHKIKIKKIMLAYITDNNILLIISKVFSLA